jgi:hypothetical protein
MTGDRSPKRKGNGYEYEIRDLMRLIDPQACRVVGSGAFGHLPGMASLKGDVRAKLTNRDWVIECKRSKNGHTRLYKWLEKDGADILTVRADHKPTLIIMDEARFKELMERGDA